jgi:hypothetical protein
MGRTSYLDFTDCTSGDKLCHCGIRPSGRSDDPAISIGEYHFAGQGQNGPIKADGHWAALYVREGGQWKIRLLTPLNDPPRPQ